MSAPAVFSPILEQGFPGCRITQISELGGGVSARAALVELVLSDDTPRRVVVRQPPGRGLRSEYAVLSWCRRLGIAVPEPYFVDESRGAIVLDYVEGDVDLSFSGLAGRLQQMAAELARIHQVPHTSELSILEPHAPSVARKILEAPPQLDATLNEAGLRSRLQKLWPWPRNPDALLHGDYWPGNLVWREGRLVAVLDWEEAAWGDPLADLAVARLDLLWAFGEAAMQSFTEEYCAISLLDRTQLPCWDLWAALRPMSQLARWAPAYAEPQLGRPDITESTLRQGHQRFVELALAELTG